MHALTNTQLDTVKSSLIPVIIWVTNRKHELEIKRQIGHDLLKHITFMHSANFFVPAVEQQFGNGLSDDCIRVHDLNYVYKELKSLPIDEVVNLNTSVTVMVHTIAQINLTYGTNYNVVWHPTVYQFAVVGEGITAVLNGE